MKKNEAELLLKTALESEKLERQRIATDLHDSVSSDLSAIRNYLILILKEETDSKKRELFTDLKEGVETAIENTRLVSYKLMPPMLNTYGFVVALDDYIIRLQKKVNVVFDLICNDELLNLSLSISYELYRVVQEFITNMTKHGSVKKCIIVIYVIEDLGYIELIDDGEKFDFFQQLDTSRGLGLKNISSRIKVSAGTLIQRDVIEGNHFVISFPIDK